ncbi:MAG: hypothetical protein SPF23_01585 [Paludibacteraceae bacterium]|nr:hypothetical protein [Paludibacteraceae bacterium]
MATDDLNIKAHLAYSEKLYGLTTGHQQETTQLLENIEQLQDDVRALLAENQNLRTANDEKDAKIKELEQRIADLQKPTQAVYGDYIETQNVRTQYQFPKTYRSSRRKLNTTDQTQLPLWNNNATYM